MYEGQFGYKQYASTFKICVIVICTGVENEGGEK
jgi:hypothetical protein